MEVNCSKVLVTGNGGYIGSTLCPILASKGFQVIGFDTGFFEGCELSSYKYFKTIRKDIRKIDVSDFRGIDAVIHLAALSNDPLGDLNKKLTEEINYKATVRAASMAKQAGVKRFIFSSSCSVYGAKGNDPCTEKSKLKPLTEYAKSKIKAEKEISKLADRNFSPVFMRNATVFGNSPRLRTDLVVNNLVGWAHLTHKIKLLSDGSAWRPLIHVEDLSNAFIKMLQLPTEAIHNQVFNIGFTEQNYTIKELAEAVQKALPECEIEIGNPDKDNRSYKVSFDKFAQVTKMESCITLHAAICELVSSYRMYGLKEEEFHNKFVRLKHIRSLISEKRLTGNLYWTGK